MAFIPHYPTAHSLTYVKATSYNTSVGYPYFATDPAKPLTGTGLVNWQTDYPDNTDQKFNIDLGAAYVIVRVYLENYHFNGLYPDRGVNNFTVHGTNSAAAFANTTYATTTDLTLLGTFQADEHSASDSSDPQYFDLSSNTTAYRYYVIRVSDNHGNSDYIALRHIELQTTSDVGGIEVSTPEVSGLAVNNIVGLGSIAPAADSLSGLAVNNIVGLGSIVGAKPIVTSVAFNTYIYSGEIKPSRPIITGAASTEIVAWGRIQPATPSIKGYWSFDGGLAISTPQVAGAAVNQYAVSGGVSASPTIGGAAEKWAVGEGRIIPRVSSVQGVSVVGPVTAGNIIPPAAAVSGVALINISCSGNIQPDDTKVSGSVAIANVYDDLVYDRNRRCRL